MEFQPQLEDLAPGHEAAFLAFVEDLRLNDSEWFRRHYGDPAKMWAPADFRAYVKKAEAARLDWRPKANKVSVSRYVVRNPPGAIIATGWLRFPLDEVSEADGGNLTCDVPPSLRRKGYGSVCLSLLLFEAVRAGLRRVLVTCGADDIAARRVIELNRGKFQDVVTVGDAVGVTEQRASYWISF